MTGNSDKKNNVGPSPERTFGQSCRIFIWKMVPFVVLLLAAVLLIGATFRAIIKRKAAIDLELKEAGREQASLSVNVAVWPLTPSELIDDIRLPGIVFPWEELTLQAQVSGRIIEIVRDEGDGVLKGETIARIDERDYKVALRDAEAQLALDRQTFERNQRLVKENIVPKEDLDKAQAAVNQAEASVELAKLALDRCTITAPFGGTINKRYIKLGSLVSPGSNVVDILDTHKVKVAIGIPEMDVDLVRRLEKADITVAALGGKRFVGKKTFLSKKPIEEAQTFLLHLAVENPDDLLRPGMFADVNIVRRRQDAAIVVPLFSVITRGDDMFCFLAVDGRAVRREVTIGIIKGLAAEVTSGLSAGDALIVRGHRQVENGQDIRIMRTVSNPEDLMSLI